MRYPADKPCPHPGKMVIVNSPEGAFWRMKPKESGGAENLNDALKANMERMSELSPAASKVVKELKTILNGLDLGRITVRMKSCLHRSMAQEGRVCYSYFAGLKFQPRYRLDKLLIMAPTLREEGEELVMRVDIPEWGAVKKRSELITGYKLAMIMVVGSPVGEGNVDVFEKKSPLYEPEKAVAGGCELRMLKPTGGEPWMVCLRIVSYEGVKVAVNPRHAGMKVIGWG